MTTNAGTIFRTVEKPVKSRLPIIQWIIIALSLPLAMYKYGKYTSHLSHLLYQIHGIYDAFAKISLIFAKQLIQFIIQAVHVLYTHELHSVCSSYMLKVGAAQDEHIQGLRPA